MDAVGYALANSISVFDEVSGFTSNPHTISFNDASGCMHTDGKFYFHNGGSSMRTWDPETGEQVTTGLTAHPITSIRNTAAVHLDGLLYYVGGNNGSTYYSQLYEYDPLLNTWTAKANSGMARTRMGICAIGTTALAVFGGADSVGVTTTLKKWVKATNTWSEITHTGIGSGYGYWNQMYHLNGYFYILTVSSGTYPVALYKLADTGGAADNTAGVLFETYTPECGVGVYYEGQIYFESRAHVIEVNPDDLTMVRLHKMPQSVAGGNGSLRGLRNGILYYAGTTTYRRTRLRRPNTSIKAPLLGYLASK